MGNATVYFSSICLYIHLWRSLNKISSDITTGLARPAVLLIYESWWKYIKINIFHYDSGTSSFHVQAGDSSSLAKNIFFKTDMVLILFWDNFLVSNINSLSFITDSCFCMRHYCESTIRNIFFKIHFVE